MFFKKLIFAAVVISMTFPSFAYAKNASEKNLNVYINSMEQEEFLNEPYEKNGVVYLPLRELCEKLGYTVAYSHPYAIIDRGPQSNTVSLSEDTLYYGEINIEIKLKNKIEVSDGVMYIPSDLLYRIFYETGLSVDEGNVLITWRDESNKNRRENDYTFAVSLLNELPETENSVIAVESLKTALAMTANGTEGKTREQILNALNISELESYNRRSAKNLELWENSPFTTAVYTSANSIWINGAENELQKEFKDTAENYYKSTAEIIENSDISPINEWVEEKTDGYVKSPVKDAEFEIVLLNAALFEGTWICPFDGDNKKGIFHNADGTEIDIDYMVMDKPLGDEDLFQYYEEEGMKALTLAYGTARNTDIITGDMAELYTPYDMTFVLSDKPVDNGMLERIFNGSKKENVYIQMPEFEIDNNINIKEMLKNMGVSNIFEPGEAELSPMLKEGYNYYVSDIIQNTAISVDEKGTRAASVSSVSLVRSIPEQKKFIADRPFYYFLRDKETGEILFEGKFAKAE